MSDMPEAMWGRSNIRKRYTDDPSFRALVDTLYCVIDRAEFTPTEIREAAMLAQIMYEERNPRPIAFTLDDVAKGRV